MSNITYVRYTYTFENFIDTVNHYLDYVGQLFEVNLKIYTLCIRFILNHLNIKKNEYEKMYDILVDLSCSCVFDLAVTLKSFMKNRRFLNR